MRGYGSERNTLKYRHLNYFPNIVKQAYNSVDFLDLFPEAKKEIERERAQQRLYKKVAYETRAAEEVKETKPNAEYDSRRSNVYFDS